MAIAYENNTSIAFDTDVLKNAAKEYGNIAVELKEMASQLDELISNLKDSGWTTPAGTAFYEMMDTNWSQNIGKYASLLETLQKILTSAATQYEGLMKDHVRVTKVSI